MSEVNDVIVVAEGNRECHCVVVACILTFHWVLVVAYIVSRASPPSPVLTWVYFRVKQGTHSVVVERVWLHHVDYIESVELPHFRISNTEVVPLSVALCVGVRRQNQVVLELIHLDRSSQISTFESRLKDQSVVIIALLLVERMEVSVFLLCGRTPRCWWVVTIVGRGVSAVVDHSIH